MPPIRLVLLSTAFLLSPAQLRSQTPASSIRDSVHIAIDRLIGSGGTFSGSHAAGSFTGDRGGFNLLYRVIEQGPDSVLMTLVECFTDTSATRVKYRGRPLSRGGLCYLALHNLAYRETDPDQNWPGNFFDFPTPDRLRAAQQAWREAVKKGWYSTL